MADNLQNNGTARPELICAFCGRGYLSHVGTFREDWRCQQCGATVCFLCWDAGVRFCSDHKPADLVADQLVEKVVGVPEVSIPPGAITRKQAKEAEESFISHMSRVFTSLTWAYEPVEGRIIETTAGAFGLVVQTLFRDLVKSLVERHVGLSPAEVMREMPCGKAVAKEIVKQELFGGTKGRVTVAACSVSPFEDLVRDGYSSRKLSQDDAMRVRKSLARDPNVFHWVGLYSTTGWTDECRAYLTNGHNILLCLIEQTADGWKTTPVKDHRWKYMLAVFETRARAERVKQVRDFIAMERLTEAYVAEKLGMAEEIVREAFEAVCRENAFIRMESDGTTCRLVRAY
jgi:hypothetical protein